MNSMLEKYYNEVNVARGIALIFVTLGHSLSMAEMPDAAVWLYRFCYSFHMGLFFFLSGFVSKKYLIGNVDISRVIIKKAKRLMIPYCFFSFLTLLMKMAGGVITEWNKSILFGFLLGESVNESLWYLWTLFIISIIVILLCKLLSRMQIRNKFAILFLSAIGGYCSFETFEFPYGLGNIFKYMIFFMFGLWMANYYHSLKFFLQKARYSLIVVWIVLAILVSINLNIWYIITASLGVYVVMGVSLKITTKENLWYKMLMCLGNYAYEVYLISYFIQTLFRQVGEKMNLNYWLIMLGMFGISMIVPILISKFIIRKNRMCMGIFGLR